MKMNINIKYILPLLGMLLLMSACTEEKTFVIDSTQINVVNFEAENMVLGSVGIARSARITSGGFNPEGEYRQIRLTVCDGNNPGQTYEQDIWWNGGNVVVAGGNNEIKFTFKPKCPEEKSMRLTTPWGKEYELTAKDSVVSVVIDRNFMGQTMNPDLVDANYLVVTGESRYRKDNVDYCCQGYVMIRVDTSLEYVKSEGRWSGNNWLDQPLEIKGNCNFYARNLSVATLGINDDASTVWYEGYDYYPGMGNRDESFVLPLYHINDDGSEEYLGTSAPFYLYDKNALWSGLDNEIEFIFRPSVPDEEAKLSLPDGKVFYATPKDTTFVWTLGSNLNIDTWSERFVVTAQSSYVLDGIKHFNDGYLLIDAEPFRYDKASGKWFSRNSR